MPTDPMIDPSLTTVTDVTPPSSSELQPSDLDPTEDVEELKRKLAAAETEANRWKGRVEKATKEKPAKTSPVSEEDMQWFVKNNQRVELVNDAYQKELDELLASGAKPTNDIRDKALKLAESSSGVSKTIVQTTDDSFPAPGVDRSGGTTPKLTQHDVAFGVKPETIKEYRDIVEGR